MLVDGDLVMNESGAIALYLANAYSGEKNSSFYPADDPKTRARIDQRMFFNFGTFYKAFWDTEVHR